MATSGRLRRRCNVQVAVDTEHHLIVTHEVTNSGSDRSQLANTAKQAKAILPPFHCPIARSLAVVGDRWTILIMRDLARLGPRKFRFGALLERDQPEYVIVAAETPGGRRGSSSAASTSDISAHTDYTALGDLDTAPI